MITIHNLGFPRIGVKRELKKILESYWQGKLNLLEFEQNTTALRLANLKRQQELGVEWVPVFDFACYDHVLAHSMLLGAIPQRFQAYANEKPLIDTLFAMARGEKSEQYSIPASEMTKWFDTNYHYIVPELADNMHFKITDESLFTHTKEALELGIASKPVLLGPVSYLHLGKFYSGANSWERKLALLPALLEVYKEIFSRLHAHNVKWIQLDEPIFALELPQTTVAAVTSSTKTLHTHLSQLNAAANHPTTTQLLVASYFNDLGAQLTDFARLQADGFHLDLVNTPTSADNAIISAFSATKQEKMLSLGIINGRNIWRTHLHQAYQRLTPFTTAFSNVGLAPSCSLMHVPVTLQHETKLAPELSGLLAFAEEKLGELQTLAAVLRGDVPVSTLQAQEQKLAKNSTALGRTDHSVQTRVTNLQVADFTRNDPFALRQQQQQAELKLPRFPTTTIGSFPQTAEIRQARRKFKKNLLSATQYEEFIKNEIKIVIEKQEALGLDVLVHGEAERNDMVEYFADKLTGYAFTAYGWVQSYGSRCVKPPIIYGDVKRKHAMTVAWAKYAQTLTAKPVKGMLTGPITMLQWSFVRSDQARKITALQLALALQDEVKDLETAGIRIIQIDEPAIREGLPLRKKHWNEYLDWAVKAFTLTNATVRASTQIQTHMCYSYFTDIIAAIVALDADVILIESSRSKMALLKTLTDFNYPANIGPGIYDIHSPRVPPTAELVALLEKALKVIAPERLWVNPDCGLKTRAWSETEAALKNLVASAKLLRERAPA